MSDRLTGAGGPMRSYYDARAQEYDSWWLGTGLFAPRERPGWDADREALRRTAPDLGLELSIAVAVLPQRAGGTADLSGFAALGCQTLAYEQGSKRRPRFLGWAAAL